MMLLVLFCCALCLQRNLSVLILVKINTDWWKWCNDINLILLEQWCVTTEKVYYGRDCWRKWCGEYLVCIVKKYWNDTNIYQQPAIVVPLILLWLTLLCGIVVVEADETEGVILWRCTMRSINAVLSLRYDIARAVMADTVPISRLRLEGDRDIVIALCALTWYAIAALCTADVGIAVLVLQWYSPSSIFSAVYVAVMYIPKLCIAYNIEVVLKSEVKMAPVTSTEVSVVWKGIETWRRRLTPYYYLLWPVLCTEGNLWCLLFICGNCLLWCIVMMKALCYYATGIIKPLPILRWLLQ